jgi:hypothetical protein
MNRAFYSDSITDFLHKAAGEILGALAMGSDFAVEQTQSDAWLEEIRILHSALSPYQGSVFFEYSIPRIGRRIDVVLLIGPAVFVLEFKVGERNFTLHAVDQVVDYALDLKNFHEPTHNCSIAPILIATKAADCQALFEAVHHKGGLFFPIKTTGELLGNAINAVLRAANGPTIDRAQWESGRYCPTPTIIEAAIALYSKHSVADIARRDASAINLSRTSESISSIIQSSKARSNKAICFVTGVPGAGKTLVGLNMATTHTDKASELYSVFLSGNAPLVAILREALARDKIRQLGERGGKSKIGNARSEVQAFVQNIHHFRDESIRDAKPPVEHVVIFDEAQRAWDRARTSSFMRRRKRIPNFNHSEPDFLISCMDRHRDWAVIICLVGGGQEINTGEAGITEWIDALLRSFPDWHIYISPHLTDTEYGAGEALSKVRARPNVIYKDDLHLGVSMRSFRAENVSLLVKQILDLEMENARMTLKTVSANYPIMITRDLAKAKRWLKDRRPGGTERYGIVVSSQAERLKPDAINVRAPLDPIHWFLDGKEDVRSSFYLEDAATEFHVQGLELDWTCVAWDADFRYSKQGWEHWSFCGDRWHHINKEERRNYLKNAYRVLLTRARQGMVIVVPPGDESDPTRSPGFYDSTFAYLREVGFPVM